jgi:hypothetical protein
LIAGFGVVGTIAGNLTDLTVNLFQQRWKHLAIMNMAPRNFNGHNLFCVFIDSQVKFAPKTAVIASMLLPVPLPGSVDPKTGGINDNVTRIVVP